MIKTCPKCHCQVPDENEYCVCMYNFTTGLTLKETQDGKTGDNFVIDFLMGVMNGKNIKT